MDNTHKKKQILLYCASTLGILGVLIVLVYQLLGGAFSKTQNKPKKFGATYMTMDNLYFEAFNSRLAEVIDANGDILITRDPSQNQEKQNEQILDMIDAGVDLIFVNPADWKKITPALIACNEAHVPLINVDTNVYDKQYVNSIVLSDNYGAGVLIAKDVMAKRKSAKIVIMDHESINSTHLRVQGFLDTIKGSSLDYEIVAFITTTSTLESSMEKMQEVIDQGVAFDVVFGGNDPTALGALAAMQKNHAGKGVLLYGIDGSPAGKAMIKKGYMEGSSAQFPLLMAQQAAKMAYDLLDKKPIDQLVYVPVQLITKENIDKFDFTGWQ